jgi:8-oxo-dGTP pyrophosphatase MutT (NUDIX family)
VKGDFWDFPRGKIERGETEQQTAVREIREETGLSEVAFVPGFRKMTSWYYRWKGANIYKEATYFLAEVKSEKVKISHEHVEFVWVDFRDAMQTLTYDNTKEIMRAAHSFLQNQDKGSIG